ncbi:endonuclease/exonuclease/phosphatase family protein [Sulfitobacter aestuariivivens]|uniref:Endonuclease/exonuclease/phosphatase family protein n=1 Tax=Sulfitobacter aestuariivivens TaxID=2766981 RepID=A0A927D415_9RHOB|nr:endonuclease/exonuclease/phosphatase family protein [Sulfitobacter aestuariivivens]MBD3664728.1 endonuclease/exonuclease/phosphatase family protein [Sulfitobacter aestuariivivens]
MTFAAIIVLWTVTGVLVVATALPFTKVSHGSIQGLAFPREQFLGVALVAMLAFWYFQPDNWGIGLIAMGVVALIQAIFIIKFTPVWPRQSVEADRELLARKEAQISVLAANVKQSNRDYPRLIGLIKERQPDVVMAIETDAKWIDALKSGLTDEYEAWVEVPKDNGYGLCLMSRLALSETEVRELITKDVPSIRTTLSLRDGRKIRLYVVHPEPPVIDHDTIGRDSEIAMVGLEATKDDLPCVVSGDLNDVAWSTTTRRFQRLSRLLDPRVGRGFYNTFSATMPWMRWPLDHLFHDAQFRLIEMARERKIGSDHFPMWFSLVLADTASINSDPGDAEVGEVVQAKREIIAERRRDREPIGSDWEDEN